MAPTARPKAYQLNTQYEVGDFYIQFPSADSPTVGTALPTTMYPAVRFGGTWTAMWTTKNFFFRTQGTDYQARDAEGISADQMQQITGSFRMLYSYAESPTGAFSLDTSVATSASGSSVTGTQGINFNSANSSGARTGLVTESRNRLWIIWKRTA